MARTLTAGQTTNVEAASTRPIYIIDFGHSGATEYLSCSGDVTYGGQAYTGGELRVTQIVDSDVATITMPATSTRVTEVTTSTWRNGSVVIRLIPGAPGDSGTYTSSPDEAIVVMDGIIQSSNMSGEVITVTVKNKYFTGALAPRLRLDQIAHHIPPVGSTSTWDSEEYSHEAWLKVTAAIQQVTRPGVQPSVVGRPSASQINEATDPAQNTGYNIISGEGVAVPIVYGRTAVEGFVFADYTAPGGVKYVGVAWCLGQVNSVEQVFISDSPLPTSGVAVRHYKGTATQGVDSWLSNNITGYSDDMVFHFGGGDVGVCYSVFRISPSIINGPPKFRAVIQGRLVNDPSSSSTDPYSDYVALDVDFTTGTTDASANAHTVTLNGDAGIASPSVGLALDGTGDYASIADHASLEIGSQEFTLEIEASGTNASGSPQIVETLISHGTAGSPGGALKIDRIANNLYLYLSSDGQVWDLANGVECGDLTNHSPIGTATFRIVVERVGDTFFTWFDGQATSFTPIGTSSPTLSPRATGIYDSASEWQIGAVGGAQEWTGVVKSVRLTIGAYRYGGVHPITASPYSDSASYSTGLVYSDNPALCWADLASDAYTGLGATTSGVATAAAYCDGALNGSPAVARCKIGLSIKLSQAVTKHLDRLAAYANAIWFVEGSDLKIVPDQANTQSPEFQVTKWVKGSLQVSSVEQEQTPTMVTVAYTEPVADSAAWETKSYTIATLSAAAE